MGYSQLFANGWTWGNLVAEGVGAFLFTLILMIGSRYADNMATPLSKRMTLAGVVLAAVLVGTFVSLGISELYRRSSGAPILTPIFGIFYAFIIGEYYTLGIIIAAQVVGSLIGFLIAIAIRPRLQQAFASEAPSGVKGFFWRGIGIMTLLICVAVLSLINPTSYGGTFVLKTIIMALAFTVFVAVFGRVEFYTYTTLFALAPLLVSVKINKTIVLGQTMSVTDNLVYRKGPFSVYSSVRTIKNSGLFGIAKNRHLEALMFQFASLGVLIGIYALMQVLPDSVSISNVI